MRDLAALAVAFACGAIPFGVILVRLLRGVDVRTLGSGNIGATNVARTVGPALGVLVLMLDGFKGAAAVLLGPVIAGPAAPAWLSGALACAAVAGHVFTPWLRFKGGKGVATALGALIVFDLRLALIGLAAFAAVLAASRIVSLGSVAAAVAAAAAGFVWRRGPAASAFLIALTAALVVVRHLGNLRRVLSGAEPRLGRGPAPGRGV